MTGIGVVGYGYWGPNLVRNFSECPGAKVVGVSDLRSEQLEKVRARYPSVTTTTDYRELLSNKEIDAIVVATPVAAHFEVALAALKAGKHVLLEKPMTSSADQARQLVAAAGDRVLMVDHTFLYTSAVRKIKDLVASGELGDIYYYDSVRVNLGLFQHDVDVVWDLAVHDLSILDFVLPVRPVAVSASGISHLPGKPVNIAYLTLIFDSPMIAHVHVNWLSPVKVRRTMIGGSRKMIIYDELEPSEKIKIYDKGVTVSENDLRVGYRSGDMWAPQIGMEEALRSEAIHFVDCIKNGKQPMTDGRSGLRVVDMLEAAKRSMDNGGRREALSK